MRASISIAIFAALVLVAACATEPDVTSDAYRAAQAKIEETENIDEIVNKIRRKRAAACPWRAPNRGMCRREWALEHPEEAALLEAYDDRQ